LQQKVKVFQKENYSPEKKLDFTFDLFFFDFNFDFENIQQKRKKKKSEMITFHNNV
jgi:hypothetical protein